MEMEIIEDVKFIDTQNAVANQIEITACRGCGKWCVNVGAKNKYSMYVCFKEEVISVGVAFEQVHGVQLAAEDCVCAQCIERLLDVVGWQSDVARRIREQEMSKGEVAVAEATSAVGATSTDEAPSTSADAASAAGGSQSRYKAANVLGCPSPREGHFVCALQTKGVLCMKEYNSRAGLIGHRRLHHPGHPEMYQVDARCSYVCALCRAVFASKSNHNRHCKNKHHSHNPKIRCAECEQTFVKAGDYRKHFEIEHGKR